MVVKEVATRDHLPRLVTGHPRQRARLSWLSLTTGAALLALVGYVGARFFASDDPVHLVVYAFSTQEEVLTHSIFPAFEEIWEAENGRELSIEAVFGPSAMLAGQINLGAPADMALLSNAHHVTYLQLGGLFQENAQPQVIGYTPMVIVTRAGNPHDIRGFADLARPGLHLLHANPRSSGGGEWALLAEYGNVAIASSDHDDAAAQLNAIWRNVSVMAPSARAALTLFELGAGDALVTYEQDAMLARDRGVPLEIVHPPYTIIAEPVAVIVGANVTRSERPVVAAFLRYLLSAEGQRRFSRYYQRPAADGDISFAPLRRPFTVEDLGGWPAAYQQVVVMHWRKEIEPHLQLDMPAVCVPGISSRAVDSIE